jgi:hypothetical protein
MTRGTVKLIIVCGILVVGYGVVYSYSVRGWGYAGYGGRRHDNGMYSGYRSPSIFYWGGASYYGNPSVRTGSVSGSGRSGAGPGAGK